MERHLPRAILLADAAPQRAARRGLRRADRGADAAAAQRLSGDRHPGLRRDHPDQRHQPGLDGRAQRPLRRAPAHLSGLHLYPPAALLLSEPCPAAGHPLLRGAAGRLAHRSRLGIYPRGRVGRGSHGDRHRAPQAAGLRPGRDVGRDGRCVPGRAALRGVARELYLQPIGADPDHRGAGRAGQHPRRDPGRGRGGEHARAAAQSARGPDQLAAAALLLGADRVDDPPAAGPVAQPATQPGVAHAEGGIADTAGGVAGVEAPQQH